MASERQAIMHLEIDVEMAAYASYEVAPGGAFPILQPGVIVSNEWETCREDIMPEPEMW